MKKNVHFTILVEVYPYVWLYIYSNYKNSKEQCVAL